MSADPTPATGSITVRLPIDLLGRLDELCALTQRTRTYWITEALQDVIGQELGEARIVHEHFQEDDADPDTAIPDEQIDDLLVAEGLTTREALDRARARHGRTRA